MDVKLGAYQRSCSGVQATQMRVLRRIEGVNKVDRSASFWQKSCVKRCLGESWKWKEISNWISKLSQNHAHMYTHVHTLAFTHTQHINARLLVHYAYMYTHTHTPYTHIQIERKKCSQWVLKTNAHIHVYINTHASTYTPTHHIHIPTHLHTCSDILAVFEKSLYSYRPVPLVHAMTCMCSREQVLLLVCLHYFLICMCSREHVLLPVCLHYFLIFLQIVHRSDDSFLHQQRFTLYRMLPWLRQSAPLKTCLLWSSIAHHCLLWWWRGHVPLPRSWHGWKGVHHHSL